MFSRKSHLSFVLTAAAALLLLAGCGGNEPDNDQCQALPGACRTAGEMRCSDDGLAVEECRENADGCLAWTESEPCSGGHICDDSGSRPECTCSNACASEGSTQCLGDIVQRCESDADGCLGWADRQDCGDSGQVCDDSGGAASCAEPCSDLCDFLSQSECSGTVIRRCAAGANGCLEWQDFRDCADDGLFCDDTGGEAVCTAQCVPDCDTEGAQRCSGTVIDDSVTPPVCASIGESCTDFRLVDSTPYVRSGSDFAADYSDDQTLSGTGCMTRTGSAEAVFAIDLAAGKTVIVRELGDIDVVISFQGACGDAEACILSEDYDEVAGFQYTATGAQRLFIIVESYYRAPGMRDYEIHVDRPMPEICGDLTDNDADGLTDCDDPDCGAAPECQPYLCYWEQFETGDTNDINGYRLVFTPDPGEENLYTWAVTGGIGAYGVTPGSGTVTRTLTLGDDETAAYALSVMSEVRVFDTPYTSFFVSSNGNVTFGDSDPSYNFSLFFSYVRIGGFYRDLDPRTTGTITVDETAGRVAVTWDAVPEYDSATTLNSFQIVIDASGVIEIYYVDVQSTTGMIGISNGTGIVIPEETNFVP